MCLKRITSIYLYYIQFLWITHQEVISPNALFEKREHIWELVITHTDENLSLNSFTAFNILFLSNVVAEKFA